MNISRTGFVSYYCGAGALYMAQWEGLPAGGVGAHPPLLCQASGDAEGSPQHTRQSQLG